MKSHRAVAVYIINKQKQILLLEHKKLKSWLPPGGHVEISELTHEAAIREVREEAGIEIEFICNREYTGNMNDSRAKILPAPFLVQLEDIGDHFHEDFVYLARANSDQIINNENHNIAWFDIEKAIELNIFENVRSQLLFIKDKILL
jgi:8-oxo-dGTP pyrophosphatase MutT (NUDIX family)